MTIPEIAVDTKPVVFVDLAAQHREVEAAVATGFARVMAATAFINGPDVAAFEQEWARYTGTRHAVGVSSGTDALELALRAAGVGPGDEVIVPANSFIASASAVARAGARPVFVDCDPNYYLIDPARVADAITERTRAIMPVHLYGQLAPMEDLVGLAEEAGALIVEDAAQCHGASRHGRRAGAWGVAAATSFYPGKNLGAYGDAGAVATNDDSLASTLTALRDHGGHKKYEHPILGFNSRLDTLQAVVLSAKLARLEEWNTARRAAAHRYGSCWPICPACSCRESCPVTRPSGTSTSSGCPTATRSWPAYKRPVSKPGSTTRSRSISRAPSPASSTGPAISPSPNWPLRGSFPCPCIPT